MAHHHGSVLTRGDGTAAADPAPGSPARDRRGGVGSTLADLAILTKPRITGLVVATAAAGFLAAGGAAGLRLLHLLAGTALLAGGTNAFNQLLERDADARMVRTRRRPLPDGRLAPAPAAAFACLLVAGGGAWLLLGTNALTAALGVASTVLYAAAYTPLKRRSPVSLVVGAVPGALPALGGWTAARGRVDAAGLALFGIVFLWQLPHFLALGHQLRDDYRRAGFSVLAVEDPTGTRSGRAAVLSALALFPMAMLPVFLGVAGWGYGLVAAALGGVYLVSSARFGAEKGDDEARSLFRVSLAYLPLLFVALVADAVVLELPGPSTAMLPTLNAALNATAAVALVGGFAMIRRGRVSTHRGFMLTAAAASAVFLASYLVYHAEVGSVGFQGEGWIRTAYLAMLASHVVLAAVVVPLALSALSRALTGKIEKHRRIVRWTLPIWLYVSVTGLVVYVAAHVA